MARRNWLTGNHGLPGAQSRRTNRDTALGRNQPIDLVNVPKIWSDTCPEGRLSTRIVKHRLRLPVQLWMHGHGRDTAILITLTRIDGNRFYYEFSRDDDSVFKAVGYFTDAGCQPYQHAAGPAWHATNYLTLPDWVTVLPVNPRTPRRARGHGAKQGSGATAATTYRRGRGLDLD